MIEAPKRPRKSFALPRSPIRLSSSAIRQPPLQTKSLTRAMVSAGGEFTGAITNMARVSGVNRSLS